MASNNYSLRMYPNPLMVLGHGSITGVYAQIGTPLPFPVRLIKFQNTTDVDVIISWDGIVDHQYIPSNGSFDLFDITTNKINDQGFYITKGQRFFVSDAGTIPTLGSVIITSFYGIIEGD